jgi:POT family proton-dependent oligopeptide transporter
MLIQFQGFYGQLLLAMGTALLLYVLAIALFKLPYGEFSKAPESSLFAFIAGTSMLFIAGLAVTFSADAFTAGLTVIVLGVSVIVGVTVMEAIKKEDHVRDRFFAILFLLALQPLFWGLFEQAGGSINLFTDRFVDRAGVPTSLFQSINPIYIILLGPIFAWLWTTLGRKGIEPSTPAKFGIALLQLGAGFILFQWGGNFLDENGKMAVGFLFLIYFLHTTAELCLSPVGLSAMNRLAPAHMASLIMGAWFFATAGGNFVAGKIGEATGGEGGTMEMGRTLDIYGTIGWVSVGVGVVVILLSFFVKRWMHLDTLKDEEPAAEQAA